MTDLPLSERELETRLQQLVQQHREHRAFALRPRADALDGKDLFVDGRRFVVRSVESSLDVRDALRGLEGQDQGLVLLTDLRDRDLGQDVLARVARHMVIEPRPWDEVRAMLDVRRVDPRVARQKHVAKILVKHAPADGWPPVASGVLDAGQAWGMVLRAAVPGLRDAESVDLQMLLEWSLVEDHVHAWRHVGEIWPSEHLDVVFDIVERRAGVIAGRALAALQRGAVDDLVAWGLVADCLVRAPEAPATLKISGKLEDRLQIAVESVDVLQPWASAALTVAQRRDLRDDLRAATHDSRKHADQILDELGGPALAVESDVLPQGFRQRLDAFAAAVNQAIDNPTDDRLEAVEQTGDRVRAHEGDERNELRRTRVRMIGRLLRWLTHQSEHDVQTPAGLGEALETYRRHGGLVDHARAQLWRPENHEALAAAMRKLDQRVRDAREQQNQHFGRAVATWMQHGSPGPAFLPIEDVLRTVVAPVAVASRNVLLVVLDGMSMAIYRELRPSLEALGWAELVPADQGRPWTAVATMPSVTEFSRTSLLCGRLERGNQSTEREGFQTHPELQKVSMGGKPPVLFHKKHVGAWTDAGKGQEIFEAVRDPKRRVVGVVLNDVDDFLAKHEPSIQRWDVNSLDPLAALLETAIEADRLVILTSDHGHVLEHDMTHVEDGAGERYRLADKPDTRYEIVVEGTRVDPGALDDRRRVVAPWSERVRYASTKHGYHGGVTPQEMVVPLGVFTSDGRELEGWVFAPSDTPVWWDPEAATEPTPASAKPRRARVGRKKKAVSKKPGQTALFPEPKSESTAGGPVEIPSWVERLLESSVYQEQRAAAGPAGLKEERLKLLLAALDARGRLSKAAAARAMRTPEMRVRPSLSAAQRVLNVEGYPVLDVDGETGEVRLNREYLEGQFGVGA